jgi:hypothetical protein
MGWGAGPAFTLRFGMEYERAILRWFSSLPQLAERTAGRKAVRTRRLQASHPAAPVPATRRPA